MKSDQQQVRRRSGPDERRDCAGIFPLHTATKYCQLALGFPIRRYGYGPHPSQFADLFLPATAA